MKIFLVSSIFILLGLLSLEIRAEAEEDAKVMNLFEQISSALPDNITVKTISRSEETHIYQIELSDNSFLYAFNGGNYMVRGELYHLQSGYLINLTESKARVPRRIALVNSIKRKDMIIFSPKSKPKGHITVFTDTDCGYCRKLHQDIDDLQGMGIEVRYAAYPRTGPESAVARKMASAWCSNDRQRAITRLKRGQSLDDKDCKNPIAAQYRLGKKLGITGTPTLFSHDGKVAPGYMEPERIAKWLGL